MDVERRWFSIRYDFSFRALNVHRPMNLVTAASKTPFYRRSYTMYACQYLGIVAKVQQPLSFGSIGLYFPVDSISSSVCARFMTYLAASASMRLAFVLGAVRDAEHSPVKSYCCVFTGLRLEHRAQTTEPGCMR